MGTVRASIRGSTIWQRERDSTRVTEFPFLETENFDDEVSRPHKVNLLRSRRRRHHYYPRILGVTRSD